MLALALNRGHRQWPSVAGARILTGKLSLYECFPVKVNLLCHSLPFQSVSVPLAAVVSRLPSLAGGQDIRRRRNRLFGCGLNVALSGPSLRHPLSPLVVTVAIIWSRMKDFLVSGVSVSRLVTLSDR